MAVWCAKVCHCVVAACGVTACFGRPPIADAEDDDLPDVGAELQPDAATDASMGGAPNVGAELQPDASTDASMGGAPTACRVLHQDYAVGSTVSTGRCSESCRCGEFGVLTECTGTVEGCEWAGPVLPCAQVFPDAEPGEPLPTGDTRTEGAIAENRLTLDVLYRGPCATHEFGVCYRPGGEPRFVELVLLHDRHDEQCESRAHEVDVQSSTLDFDLSALQADPAIAAEVGVGIVQTSFGPFALGQPTCEELTESAQLLISRALQRAETACSEDEDCALTSARSACSRGCWTAMSGVITTGALGFEADVSAVSALWCPAASTQQCEPVAPACEPAGPPVCVQGHCQAGDSSALQTCIEDNPPTPETSELWQRTLQESGPNCVAAGADSSTEILSQEAAACIGSVLGVSGRLSLVCSVDPLAILWRLFGVDTAYTAAGGIEYEEYHNVQIDAVDGTVVSYEVWRAVP